GDLARAAAAAHAADVGDECDLWYFFSRFNRDCGRAIQPSQHDPRFHRSGFLDYERRRWLRDHRSHVENVPPERTSEEGLRLTLANLLHRIQLPARFNLLHSRIEGHE